MMEKTDRYGMIQYIGKTSNICLQIYKNDITKFTPVSNIKIANIRKLYSGFYIGVHETSSQKIVFYDWKNLQIIPGLNISPVPNEIIWESDGKFIYAIYNNQIQIYMIVYEKGLYSIKNEEIIYSDPDNLIIGYENTKEILYFYTANEIYAYLKEIKNTQLIATKGLKSLNLDDIYNSVKLPENSNSYKYLKHSRICVMYFFCDFYEKNRPSNIKIYKILQINSEFIQMCDSNNQICIIKMRNLLIKTCLYFVENNSLKILEKYLSKVKNDELHEIMKFLIQRTQTSADLAKFYNRLNIEQKIMLGIFNIDEIIKELKTLDIKILFKLFAELTSRKQIENILTIENSLIEMGNFKYAIELSDFINDNKTKSVLFARCGKYGEAYLYAKAAGDELLMNKLQTILNNINNSKS